MEVNSFQFFCIAIFYFILLLFLKVFFKALYIRLCDIIATLHTEVILHIKLKKILFVGIMGRLKKKCLWFWTKSVNKCTYCVSVSIRLCFHAGQSCMIILYLLIMSLNYLKVLLGDSLLKIIPVSAVIVPTLITRAGGQNRAKIKKGHFSHFITQDRAVFTLLISGQIGACIKLCMT